MKKLVLTLAAAALSLATLGASHARAQANLSFSGGLGSPLTITLNQSVLYTITTAAAAGVAPVFVVQNLGNVLSVDSGGTGTLAYTLNLGTPQAINFSRTGYTNNNVTAADGFFANPSSLPALAVSDVVTLRAGSLTTSYNFAGAPPAAGSYVTFISNSTGSRLSAANGIAGAVPEPSTWALLGAGVAGLGVVTLRRRATARA